MLWDVWVIDLDDYSYVSAMKSVLLSEAESFRDVFRGENALVVLLPCCFGLFRCE